MQISTISEGKMVKGVLFEFQKPVNFLLYDIFWLMCIDKVHIVHFAKLKRTLSE